MPVLNRIAAFADDMAAWRRHLHRHPELGLDCPETAAFAAALLRGFGVDALHEGLGRTGLVALIHGRAPGPAVLLRADMDALPIEEATGAPHASAVPGRMHACGHDGHTAMLLGAARYLCETRAFAGTAVIMIQPGEETSAGCLRMIEDGLLDLAPVREAYALHSLPGAPVGAFVTAPGPVMAACDTFTIRFRGQGGHAAYPHETRDPILPAAACVTALQSVPARDRDPLRGCVLGVSQIHGGTTDNVVPDTAWINGTIRTFDKAVRARVHARIAEVAQGIAASFGTAAEVEIETGYPATVNDPARTAFAVSVAREVSGLVVDDAPPEMGAEDFAFLLDRVPGCYLFVGNGDTAGLHQAGYDFDDEAAPAGASLLARLVERALPLEG
ncbi:amidohydrolase [Rubellimicrobium sp. CFH 75288]|uniref:amidohydrolase n=1 Tax=Rubellimicrobium sp. CFH 75288 TaxID=2697034 RepID=UPI001411D5D8|nr:amidohydrolase [Rubellimicrobium sp. CFH 75288]NAZ36255.1 amidohydrolase [Rubellimicrobium sp. CFH 75288]